MIITRKRYEAELEKAREEGYCRAMERREREESIRFIHERIDRLIEKIEQPKAVPGFGNEVRTLA